MFEAQFENWWEQTQVEEKINAAKKMGLKSLLVEVGEFESEAGPEHFRYYFSKYIKKKMYVYKIIFGKITESNEPCACIIWQVDRS